jgi:hypothetical protein
MLDASSRMHRPALSGVPLRSAVIFDRTSEGVLLGTALSHKRQESRAGRRKDGWGEGPAFDQRPASWGRGVVAKP